MMIYSATFALAVFLSRVACALPQTVPLMRRRWARLLADFKLVLLTVQHNGASVLL